MDYKTQVVLDNNTIDVIIEHKQNKNLYIRVTDNLELLVTCNKRVSEKEILSIIKKYFSFHKKKATNYFSDLF